MTLCLHPPERVEVTGDVDDQQRTRLEAIVSAAVARALAGAAAGGGGIELAPLAPATLTPAEPLDPARRDGAHATYAVPGYQHGDGAPVEVPLAGDGGPAGGEAQARGGEATATGAAAQTVGGEAGPGTRLDHPHLSSEEDELWVAPSRFEGHTIALLSIDRVVRVGSPRYAVVGSLARAVRWGNLLFGAGSYAIYEGPYELPVAERRYYVVRTDEPVSRRDLRNLAQVREGAGRFAFGATGWVGTFNGPNGESYLLRALITRERDAIFPPSVALLEEFWAELRSSRPDEAVVSEAWARDVLFGEIDVFLRAGSVDGAAERLADLDAQAFALLDWRRRARYLDALVRAWTSKPQEHAIVELLKASGSRSELDATLELLRRRGIFEQLFDDLDSELFSLLAVIGERFGERGAVTFNELFAMMQEAELIPRDWGTVVAGITVGPDGVLIGPDLATEAYEAARGFIRFLGGIVDAIELVITQPQQLVEGLAQLTKLILAMELAKYGHRPSQQLVDSTLTSIGRQVVFGLRGARVLGVGDHVTRRIKWALIWEVASWFIGVGEVAAVLKGAGLTERVAALARVMGILRRLGHATDAETIATRMTRLGRALRAESRLFEHEDELLRFLGHLPEEDVGRLGRLLRDSDVAEGATLAALRRTHPELADAASEVLRRAEVMKSLSLKAGGLSDEVIEAATRLTSHRAVGVDGAARVVGAVPNGEGVRFTYALRAVPEEALARGGEGVELLRALAATPSRMTAVEQLGYPVYRALWARAGRNAEHLDSCVATLADLQRNATTRGTATELRRLMDDLVDGRPQAWLALDEARTARATAGGTPPAAPPAPPGGTPPGGRPPGGLPGAPSAGRPPQPGPPQVLHTGSDTPGRLPHAPPDARAVTTGSHLHYVDASGRPLLVEGWLFPPTGGGRAPGSAAAQAAVTQGQPGLHGAHLIADRFGGAPRAANIVPFSADANLSSMKIVENMLAERLASGRQIYVQAYVRYADEGRIPAEVAYRVWAQQPNGTLARIDEVIVDFLNQRFWMQ